MWGDAPQCHICRERPPRNPAFPLTATAPPYVALVPCAHTPPCWKWGSFPALRSPGLCLPSTSPLPAPGHRLPGPPGKARGDEWSRATRGQGAGTTASLGPILSECGLQSLFVENLKNMSQYKGLDKEGNFILHSFERTSSCVIPFTDDD